MGGECVLGQRLHIIRSQPAGTCAPGACPVVDTCKFAPGAWPVGTCMFAPDVWPVGTYMPLACPVGTGKRLAPGKWVPV